MTSPMLPMISPMLGVCGGCYAMYQVWTRLIHPRIVNSLTAINDLEKIDYSKPQRVQKVKGTAVVCGGSISGIMSAAVLSRHFERVTVLEPDNVPVLTSQASGGTAENPRTRVRQYLQPHGFLQFSVSVYRKFFPTFDVEARKLGAKITPWFIDFAIGGRTINLNKKGNSVTLLSISRDGLEPLLRRLLVTDPQYSNVTYVRATATGLVLDPKSTKRPKIVGVTTRTPDGDESTLDATLVVDASGPTAIGLKFLSRLPKPVPVTRTTYDPGHMYRSCLVPISTETQTALQKGGFIDALGTPARTWGEVGFIGIAAPDFSGGERYGYSLASYEGSRVLVSISHAVSDADPDTLPSNVQDVLEAMRTIKMPPHIFAIAEEVVKAAIKENEGVPMPVNKIDLGRSHWNDYAEASKSRDFPSNLVALGDAVAKVNPAFGSGCTKATVDATTLESCLAWKPDIPENFSVDYFSRQAPRMGFSWLLIKALDFGEPAHRPSGKESWSQINVLFPLVRGAWGTVLKASSKDKFVGERLMRVMNMIDPPTALFKPYVVFRLVVALL